MTDDGGPAFPRPVSEDRSSGDQPDGNATVPEQRGMSLRDYLAAHAPPMDDEWAAFRRTDPRPEDVPEEELRLAAEWAYTWADALLAARRGRGRAPAAEATS